jgi:ketosteroid isomerase-like protein
MTDAGKIAQQAFQAFKHAMETVDEKPLLKMMTDDCVFSVPMPLTIRHLRKIPIRFHDWLLGCNR